MRMKDIIITCIGLATTCLPAFLACSTSDGQQAVLADYYLSCDSDNDCMPYGYCNEEKQCTADCRISEDCYLFGEGKLCLNCRCVPEQDVPADAIEGCPKYLADGDEDIDGDSEAEAGGTPTQWACDYRSPEECAEHHWLPNCSDRECVGYGWMHTCSEEGICLEHPQIDFGEIDDIKNASDYVGIWAELMMTAVRTTGLPLVSYQDTVSVLYTLTRLKQEGNRIIKTSKLCYNMIKNFKDDQIFDEDLAYMLTPKAYVDNSALIQQYVEDAPEMKAGEGLETSRFWEIRGAWVDDPSDVESLPTADDYQECLTKPKPQECIDSVFFDQDKDGKVAMTTVMTGVLNGEIYSVLMWSTKLSLTVLDQDHMKGLVEFTNDQAQISGSIPELVYVTESKKHEDEDRSYSRMLRFPDDATCADVLAEKDKEDSWLRLTPHMDDLPDP